MKISYIVFTNSEMKKNKLFRGYSSLIKYAGLLSFIAYSASCTKNLCDNAICLNGGTCLDGTCQCAPGFSGEHCDSYDLCYNVVCLNESYCELGNCICPSGWMGEDCGQKAPPNIVRITKIEVTRFPGQKLMGTPWDAAMAPDNKPDIFPSIQKDYTFIWNSPVSQLNAITGSVYTFVPATAIELTNPTMQYSVNLDDSDLPLAPEPMGKLFFIPFVSGNGFPETLVLDQGGPIAFRLTLDYVW